MFRSPYTRGGSDAVLAADQQVLKNALDLHVLTLFLLLYYVDFYLYIEAAQILFLAVSF